MLPWEMLKYQIHDLLHPDCRCLRHVETDHGRNMEAMGIIYLPKGIPYWQISIAQGKMKASRGPITSGHGIKVVTKI